MADFIFIGGAPRSGTTFLASILGTNPRVGVVPEMSFKRNILDWIPASGAILTDSERRELYDMVISHPRFLLWNSKLSFETFYEGIGERVYAKPLLLNVCRNFLRERTDREDYDYLVDHQPANVIQSRFLKERLPGSRFLHIYRDGRAVYSSVKNLDWGPVDAVQAADEWKRYLVCGFIQTHTVGGLDLRYEDLLNNEETVDRLFDHLGLDGRENYPPGADYFVVDYTKSYHSLVGQRVSGRQHDKWKDRLGKKEIELYEGICWALLENLGYDLISKRRLKVRMLLRLKLALKRRISAASRRKASNDRMRKFFH